MDARIVSGPAHQKSAKSDFDKPVLDAIFKSSSFFRWIIVIQFSNSRGYDQHLFISVPVL